MEAALDDETKQQLQEWTTQAATLCREAQEKSEIAMGLATKIKATMTEVKSKCETPPPAEQPPEGGEVPEGAPGSSLQPVTPGDIPRKRTKADVEAEETEERKKRIRGKGVKMSHITQLLRKENEEQQACFELPEVLIFFLVVGGCALAHYKFEHMYAVDKAVTHDIEENANFAFSGIVPFEAGRMGHKAIYDVNSIPDFWSWMSMGFIPILFPSSTDWGLSEVPGNVGAVCTAPRDAVAGWGYDVGNDLDNMYTTSPGVANGLCPVDADPIIMDDEVKQLRIYENNGESFNPSYLWFNTVVGGLRMRQERLSTQDCEVNQDMKDSLYLGKCTEAGAYYMMPEKMTALAADESLVNLNDAPDQYFKTKQPMTEIYELLRQLERDAWFSPLTNKVELMFTTYNAHQGMVTATFVTFLFNRAGHIHKRVEPVSVWLDPYHGNIGIIILDIVWILLVGKIAVVEGIDIVKHVKQLGAKRGMIEYMSPYNIVDWTNVMFSIAIVIMWGSHLGRLKVVHDMLLSTSVDVEGSFSTQGELEEWFSHLHGMVRFSYTFRVVLAVYVLLISVRFFKAFDAQPRLSLVTKTMSSATVGIIHFGVVFFTIFFIFTVSGMCLFGQEIADFANVGRASHSSFRVLLGDFDWEELHVIGRPQALLWFWAFQWVLSLTMLNMFLGIILDTYSEVKGRILSQPGVETLWSQLFEIVARKKKVMAGHNMALAKILKILDPTDLDSDDAGGEDPLLNTQSLMEKVPGLKEEQAEEILMTAFEYYGLNDDEVVVEPLESVMRRKVTNLELKLEAVLNATKSATFSPLAM